MQTILFIQLPLSDHGHNYVDGNVQYAPAALTAYIKTVYKRSASYAPEYFINYASNEVIAQYVTNSKCDAVCFTLFLWNSERVFAICKLIKARSKVKIYVGGAEVQLDSPFLLESQPHVDLFIKGEGEYFFDKLFSKQAKSYIQSVNENKVFVQPAGESFPIEHTVEPFLSGYLNLLHDRSIFFEYMRGCPYHCIYCNYSGQGGKVRQLSEERLLAAIVHATKRGAEEIYLLAPSLERSSSFDTLLEEIAKINSAGIRLHSELRTEYISFERAKLLYKAGFRSLEIGLQTLTEESLKSVGRKTNIEKTLEGIDFLIENGVDLKIGIIPGLPDDSPAGFKKTIDLLCERGYGEHIEFYPLMVLPGTKLRSVAKSYQMQYQTLPPYHILASNSFADGTIADLKEYLEERTGVYNVSHAAPDLLCDGNSTLYKGAYIDLGEDLELQTKDVSEDSYVFNYYLRPGNKKDFYHFIEESIHKQHLYTFTILSNELLHEERLALIIEEKGSDNFHSRLTLYNEWIETLPVRVFQIFKDEESYHRANKNYNLVEPYLFNGRPCDTTLSIVADKEHYKAHKESFISYYAEYTERLSLLDNESFSDFYREIGEFRKVPSFSILHYTKLMDLLHAR